MNRRRKNNIVIGTLCAVLVLMGVGYAILNTTLNIGGTANIKGDFDIHFTRIQRSSSTITDSTLLSTMDNGTGITENTSNHEGTFTAVLQKPTDYVIYEVEVANTGSIDGYLTFTFGDKHNNFDYYKDFYSVEFIRDDVDPDISTDILQPNATFTDTEVLENTTGTRTYKIKVMFKESASSFPDTTTNGDFECTLNLTYSQQAPGGGNTPTPVSSDGWIVDANGLVTHSPSDAVQNGVLRIPAVDQNGNNIVSVDQNSFEGEYNVIAYLTNNGTYAVITDQNNYEKLSAFASALGASIINDVSEIPSDKTVQQTLRFNFDTSVAVEDFGEDDIRYATLNVTTLDLSSATHLTEIGTAAFSGAPIEQIIFNNVLTTIGNSAFAETKLTSVAIPSSVQTIEISAFTESSIRTLDLSNATSLTVIKNNAFSKNHISTLTIPPSVITIEDGAFDENGMTGLNLSNATNLRNLSGFDYNSLAELNLNGALNLATIGSFQHQRDINDDSIDTLTLIDVSRWTKDEFDAIASNFTWYVFSSPDQHIIYKDVTCNYVPSLNCIPN